MSSDLSEKEVLSLRALEASDCPKRENGAEHAPSTRSEGPPNDRSIPALLNRNRAYIDGQTLRSSAPDDDGNVKLLSHTLSKLDSRFIHPVPIHQMKPVASLDDLAVLLEAPQNWEESFDAIYPSCMPLRNAFVRFQNLARHSAENLIQDYFIDLIYELRSALGVLIYLRRKQPIAIGGLLAHEKFDIIIDDGPHTWESQEWFFRNYIELLNK